MIEGLERAFAGAGQEIPPGLDRALSEAVRGSGGPIRLIEHRELKAAVIRLRLEVAGEVRAVVVKRLRPAEARRNQLAIQRWLPAGDMGGMAPELLGAASDLTGERVWQIYEDLGDWSLNGEEPGAERVAAGVREIARMHGRFSDHPVLGECRLHGGSLDFGAFEANLRDATRALEALRPPGLTPTSEQAALRDRLLARLGRLAGETPMRREAQAELGGPETLLHGDLWTTNTFVEALDGGFRVRLIDWDHAGVGPAAYDLSTLLLRFPRERRPWILDCYRRGPERAWRLPGTDPLNLMFETFELSRYASRIIWPAIALLYRRVTWGFDELQAVEDWFEGFEPVLPPEGSPSPSHAGAA